MSKIKELYLAGGCFWGVEGYFSQLAGVLETKVGYANGKTTETSYSEIKSTDHAEVIYIKYDESVISLNEILAHYFRIINPTSLNKQGGDRGRQYRTGIYFVDDSDEQIVNTYIDEKVRPKYFRKVVVEVEKLKNYIEAEEYHQKYLEKNPAGYCHINLSLAKKPL